MESMVGTFAALAWLSLAGAPQVGQPLSLGSCALPGAKPFEVRSVYWDLYQHTEVCVSFTPEPAEAGLVLTFSFTHVGRTSMEPPRMVLLRAQLSSAAILTSASVSILFDDGG